MQHYLTTTWWGWPCGSSLLFWRWPTPESVRAAQEGWPVWENNDASFPNHDSPQQQTKPEVAERLAEKVADVRMKNYIAPCGKTKSDIDYFGAIKILSDAGVVLDIRVVWDATRSELNQKNLGSEFYDADRRYNTPIAVIRVLGHRF